MQTPKHIENLSDFILTRDEESLSNNILAAYTQHEARILINNELIRLLKKKLPQSLVHRYLEEYTIIKNLHKKIEDN